MIERGEWVWFWLNGNRAHGQVTGIGSAPVIGAKRTVPNYKPLSRYGRVTIRTPDGETHDRWLWMVERYGRAA